MVVVEPDALPHLPQMAQANQALRVELLNYAVTTLAARPHTAVYLDAGNSGWLDGATTADLLERAGVTHAAGFPLNVSNYYATDHAVAYGQAVLAALGDAGASLGFVVDTSRNGNGHLAAVDDPAPAARTAGEQWCNPPGRALGPVPQAVPGPAGVHAYLWVKRPGESDGTCRGGPQGLGGPNTPWGWHAVPRLEQRRRRTRLGNGYSA